MGSVQRVKQDNISSSQYKDKRVVKQSSFHSLGREGQVGVLVKQIGTVSSRSGKENEQTQEVIFTPQCKKVHGFKVHHGN